MNVRLDRLVCDELPPGGQHRERRIAVVAGIVVILALIINVLSILGSHLWLYPDSRWYIELAVGIAERLDFADERFLVRTPGYPVMLAGVFSLFGRASPTAVLVIQHAMLVGVALLTTLTGWYLTGSRAVALLGGCLTAGSLQLLCFANVVMTEIPYTLASMGAVCVLVRYHRGGGRRFLALASMLAGMSYLFRPVGMTLVLLCLIATLHRAWANRPATTGAIDRAPSGASSSMRLSRPPLQGRWLRQGLVGTGLAIVPAVVVTLPSMVRNAAYHESQQAGCTTGLALYHRAALMEGFDAPRSEAWREVNRVVEQAKRAGQVKPDADPRRWWDVWRSYQHTRGASLAEASAVITQAASDLIAENWAQFVRKTPTHIARTFLIPDGTYRYQPGGSLGKVGEASDEEPIRHIAAFAPGLREYMAPEVFERYLPLQSEPRVTTPGWTAVARWTYEHIDRGPPVFGLGDSPYEEFILLCVMGAVVSMLRRERVTCLLVGAALFLPVATSALLAGAVPRYSVPARPLMNLLAAVLLVSVGQVCLAGIRAVAAKWATFFRRASQRAAS